MGSMMPAPPRPASRFNEAGAVIAPDGKLWRCLQLMELGMGSMMPAPPRPASRFNEAGAVIAPDGGTIHSPDTKRKFSLVCERVGFSMV